MATNNTGLLIGAAAAGGIAAYMGLLGTDAQAQVKRLFHVGTHAATGGACPGPNEGDLVLAPENWPGTTIKPLYLWTGGQLRQVTTPEAAASVQGRTTRTDIPQPCVDKLPRGADITAPVAPAAPAAPSNPARGVTDPAVRKWVQRIAGDVAYSYKVTLDSIDKAEDIPNSNYFVDGQPSGPMLRIYFTAGGGKYVATVQRDVDPERLAEGLEAGKNYGYRYYYTTSISRLY